jgi:hypothetical protein
MRRRLGAEDSFPSAVMITGLGFGEFKVTLRWESNMVVVYSHYHRNRANRSDFNPAVHGSSDRRLVL